MCACVRACVRAGGRAGGRACGRVCLSFASSFSVRPKVSMIVGLRKNLKYRHVQNSSRCPSAVHIKGTNCRAPELYLREAVMSLQSANYLLRE